MSGHNTTVATTKGSQQTVMVGSCTLAACWHITPALPDTAALVKCVTPLPATATLSCVCALGTREPSCATKPATSSFTLEAHGPQRTMRHVTALEPSSAEKRGPEPWGTWQYQSPPQQGGRVRNYETCGGAGALSREVGFRAMGHVSAPDPSSAGKRFRSCRTRDGTGALLSREARFGVVEHVAARRSMSCSLSWPHACMRGTRSAGVTSCISETLIKVINN
jgi:hypothetical protein